MIREIKCPYGDDFEGGDECDRCEQYELCMETYPPLNLIEIPKGATNGDIIKTMFPNAKFDNAMPFTDNRWETIDLDTENKIRGTYKPTQLRVYADWWNTPYKRGNENEVN